MRERFGKNDFVFVGALLVVCVAVLLAFSLVGSDGNGDVVVTKDGEEYGRYRLSGTCRVEIADETGDITNILVISDGYANMTDANCPDKLCVHQKPIRRTGENIVCLPNRVVVSVENGGEAEYDGIAQ